MNAIKRIVKFVALFLGMIVFSSCSASLLYQNDLLRPPPLGQGEGKIQDALANYLEEKPQYKFPKEGDHRSPLITIDLDGDGVDECVAFYSVVSQTDKSGQINMAVLSQADGEWAVLQVLNPEYGSDIACVEKTSFYADGTRQLVVGFATSNLTSKMLFVYEYRNESSKLAPLAEYSSYSLGSFTGRGVTELIFVTPEERAGELQLMFYSGENGQLEAFQDPVTLNSKLTACTNIVVGRGVQMSERLLIIDGRTNANFYASEILYYHKTNEWFYKGRDTTAMLNDSLRTSANLYSQDIDNDGIIEVPADSDDTMYKDGTERLHFIQWKNFSEAAGALPIVKQFGVFDENLHIFINVPKAWEGSIKIIEGDDGTWSLINDSTEELLAIKYTITPDDLPGNAVTIPNATGYYLEFGKDLEDTEESEIKVHEM